MSANKKLKCHKFPYVLKYHVPNQHTHPEEYAHDLFFMYFPFRNKNELKLNNSYAEKLNVIIESFGQHENDEINDTLNKHLHNEE